MDQNQDYVVCRMISNHYYLLAARSMDIDDCIQLTDTAIAFRDASNRMKDAGIIALVTYTIVYEAWIKADYPASWIPHDRFFG